MVLVLRYDDVKDPRTFRWPLGCADVLAVWKVNRRGYTTCH
ncbi:hypothetical protein ACFV4Q_31830 [Streptomyces nojiriensis]